MLDARMAGAHRTAWLRAAADPVFALFLVTVAVCLVRARDQPSVEVGLGSTSVSVTPADVLLVALAVVSLLRLWRVRRVPAGAGLVLVTAGAFAGWLFLSSLPNGATAIVAAGKVVELGALTLAGAVLLDRSERLVALLALVTAMTVAAVAWALVGFARNPGDRQASFLGEHDLAALSTLALALGLIALVSGRRELGRLPLVAGIAGALGVTLGAALASLLGLYLAAAGLLLAAALRRSLRLRAAVSTLLVCAAVTAGTLELRSGDLGFLYQWLGDDTEEPGAYAGSWSQRLIFAYIGGRVFLAQPVLGTGWYGELPPSAYARFVPDARERFPDQPPHYFPPEGDDFIPQQLYDQILYELGLVGAALFLALAVAAARAAVAAARGHPPSEPGEHVAYLPLTWLCAMAGALAGAALFGGSPIAALFWLVLGVAAACPSLLPARAEDPAGVAGSEPVAALR
jgi:O-antigen ligase